MPKVSRPPRDGKEKTSTFAMVPEVLLDAEVSDRAVRLWAILARYAGAAGECWPARSTLARRLRCSVPSVDRAMAELTSAGWVVKTKRRKGTAYDTTIYQLIPGAQGGFTGDRGVASPVIGGGFTGDRRVASPVTQRSIATIKRASEPESADGFAAFYSTYPRKVAKQAALKAWTKLSAEERARAAVACKAYKAATDRWPELERRYIPHAATWLNCGRYDDDQREWQRQGAHHNPDREVSAENQSDPNEYVNHWRHTAEARA